MLAARLGPGAKEDTPKQEAPLFRITTTGLKLPDSGYPPGKGEEPMPSHRFKVGDIVAINPASSRFVPAGVFEVVKQLPGNGEREYRIKSANEPHERVALESELIKA